MKIQVQRDPSGAACTIGTMFVDGVFECYTLEDIVRDGPKVFGETAIPAGTYRVVVTHSNHFNRDLPLLVDVPNFEGVRIHPGNTAKDTEGCILVGVVKLKDSIGTSVVAFNALFPKIQKAIADGEEVWITLA